jgi:hypothetical protein
MLWTGNYTAVFSDIWWHETMLLVSERLSRRSIGTVSVELNVGSCSLVVGPESRLSPMSARRHADSELEGEK